MQKTNIINGLCKINYCIWNIILWFWGEWVCGYKIRVSIRHAYIHKHIHPIPQTTNYNNKRNFGCWTSLRLLINFICSVIQISKGRKSSCSIWIYFLNIILISNYKKDNFSTYFIIYINKSVLWMEYILQQFIFR